jgi:hypothetical protein
MINATTKRFLGPVRKIDKCYTELEDGGLYISPEQLNALNSLAIQYSGSLATSTAKSMAATRFSHATIVEATAQMERTWQDTFASKDAFALGLASYRLAEFAYTLGLVWGAHYARKEKK